VPRKGRGVTAEQAVTRERADSAGVAAGQSTGAPEPQELFSPAQTVQLSPREITIVFAGLVMAMIMASLDQNIVNTALPRIVGDLGGLSHLSWIVTAFMLASTTTTPLYGKLSDMYGRKRLFTIAISIFLVGSMLCGLAQSMIQLIAFRLIQGLGAGGLMTLSQTVIGDIVEPRERGRYQGFISGAFAVSSVAGPLIGGLLTTAFTWRAVFYVNLPVGLVALVLIRWGLRYKPPQREHRVDYPGAALLAAATVALLLALSLGGRIAPVNLIGLVGVCGAFTTLFFMQERRAAEPIIGLQMFRNDVFAIGVAASGLMFMAMLGSVVFLPLYFQLVLGKDPATAGLMMTPQIAGMVISSIGGGQIVSRTGRYKPVLTIGAAVQTSALISLAVWTRLGTGPLPFEISMGFLGLGMGAGMPNITTAVQNAVDRRELGVATSSMAFVRQLGGSIGVALSGGVLAFGLRHGFGHRRLGFDPAAVTEGGLRAIAGLAAPERALVVQVYQRAISHCFAVHAGVIVVAFFTLLFLPARPLQGRHD
jgi:EmrB/QacA subfamily drug resistance transporter